MHEKIILEVIILYYELEFVSKRQNPVKLINSFQKFYSILALYEKYPLFYKYVNEKQNKIYLFELLKAFTLID